MPAAAGVYEFPQQGPPLAAGARGIASLHHPDVGTLRFRTNPNEFNWTYTLNKRVDPTYGGRVVQLLGTKIDDFTLKADCGAGRWEYMNKVATFMRDVMVVQRNGKPATFEYTTRGWKLNVFITTVPFQDSIEEVKREFEVGMKVQEDVSGVLSSNTLRAELRHLQDGIGFKRSKYNDPTFTPGSTDQESPILDLANIADLVSSIGDAIGGYASPNAFLGKGTDFFGSSFSGNSNNSLITGKRTGG